MELYNSKQREEESLLPTSSTSFRIHRSSSSIPSYQSQPSEPNTQVIGENEAHSEAFFSEDSSFADYFGVLPNHPLEQPTHTSTTSIDIDSTDERANMSQSSPEKPVSLTRRSLAALMHAHPSTSTTQTLISHRDVISSLRDENDMKQARYGGSPKLDTNSSHHSDDSLSELCEDGQLIYMGESIDLAGIEPPNTENDADSSSSSSKPGISEDRVIGVHNGIVHDVIRGDEDEENGKLPRFWSSSSSLAQTLSSSHFMEIIEDNRARFSFDDNVDAETSSLEAAEATSTSTSLKKRKRVFGDAGSDEDMDSFGESDALLGKSGSSSKFGGRKRQRLANGESSLGAPSAKRENFRKLNLKTGYKKSRMDRDAMTLARARKNAVALSRSVGPDLTPFDILDESTMDFILDSSSIPPISSDNVSQTASKVLTASVSSPAVNPSLFELRSLLLHAPSQLSSLPHDLLVKVLKETFGVEDFRFGQETAIRRVLSGHNTLLILPTGGGKSLCYQYPTVCWERGVTIVISPLLSLITDQLLKLPSCLCGVSLSSAMSQADTLSSLSKLQSGEARVLFISPEKLASQSFLELFLTYRLTVNLVCVDEAHCISTWSHNFRPSYLCIYKHAVETLGAKTVLALTATATAATSRSISELLHIPDEGLLRHHPLAEHLELLVHTPVDRHDFVDTLLKSSPLSSSGSVIVYVMFQRQADDLASYLQHRGISAASYHAGKSVSERKRVQSLFLAHQVRVMIATVAFGMGIDQQDVRAVVHFGMPKSVENYVQEVGRSGRDGLPSTCHLLFNPLDVWTLRSLAHSDTQDRPAIKSLLFEIFKTSQGESLPRHISMPIEETEEKFDMKQTTLSTIFTWLANEGKANVLQNCFAHCDISCHGKSFEELKSSSRLMLQCVAVGKRTKGTLTVPLEKLAKRRKTSVNLVCQQLSEAATSLQISVSFRGMAFNLEVREEINDQELDKLIDDIAARIKRIETVAIQKINAMVDIITRDKEVPMHDKVRKYFLSDESCADSSYFPSSSSSASLSSSSSPTNNDVIISTSAMAIVRADVKVFLSQFGDRISTPRQVARIFHGLSSPQFPKDDWQTNKFWNKSVTTPFEVIQKVAQEQLIAALTSS